MRSRCSVRASRRRNAEPSANASRSEPTVTRSSPSSARAVRDAHRLLERWAAATRRPSLVSE
jgi:hypothetical protein